MSPSRRPANSARPLYIIAAFALFAVFFFFLTRPFVESGAATSAPRWLLLFAPLDDPTFMEFVWRGLDLPAEPPTGERWFALGLGVVATLALLGLGKLAFAPFKRLLKTNVSETIFFQFGAGLALWNLCVQIAGLLGFADAPVAIPTFGFAAFYVLSTAFAASRRFAAARNGVNDVASTPLFPRQSLGDRVLLTLQVILLTIFTSFYFFSSTQPLFEYDVVEYHAQAAREIFETGALAFSPNNVYANMPLGAETLYVGGFNLVRDLCAAPDAPPRLGSLVGKVVLTAAAFATALGLFAFCVRFFRSGRAGLFAALFYLAFPGVFDVFANGLNDGVLGFALFAAFYAFALSFAADATRCDRIIFRVATASFVGVYVGLAVSIKYTAVVFVFAPAFVALLALSFPTVATPLRRLFRDAEPTSLDASASVETPTDCDAPQNADVSASNPPALRRLKNACAPLVVFVATVALVSGGWFVRNVSATGNPFYPLAFELFDDASQTWDADVDVRWRRAHSASTFGPAAFAESVARSAWRADLASPFSPFVPLIGLAVLLGSAPSINRRRRRFAASDASSVDEVSSERNRNDGDVLRLALIAVVALLFWLGWLFATHRLTRFLVPVEPLSALLLGVAVSFAATGCRSSASNPSPNSTVGSNSAPLGSASSGRGFFLVAFYPTLLFGLLYEGLVIDVRAPARIAPLRALERDPARFPQASLFFNDRPELFADAKPSDATDLTSSVSDAPVQPSRKLLLVGEAKAFVYRVPVVYSTCWNRSPLIPLLGDSVERDADGKIVAIRDADAIHRRFDDAKIAFVLVDFAELARFRSPGNYGFRDAEIDENLFRLLTAANVLAPFELPQTPGKSDATSNAPETTRVFRVASTSNDAASRPN